MGAGAVQVQALEKLKYDKVFTEWVPRVGVREGKKGNRILSVRLVNSASIVKSLRRQGTYLPRNLLPCLDRAGMRCCRLAFG